MAKSVRDENVYRYFKIAVADLARIADLEDRIGLRGMSQVIHHCVVKTHAREVTQFKKRTIYLVLFIFFFEQNQNNV